MHYKLSLLIAFFKAFKLFEIILKRFFNLFSVFYVYFNYYLMLIDGKEKNFFMLKGNINAQRTEGKTNNIEF